MRYDILKFKNIKMLLALYAIAGFALGTAVSIYEITANRYLKYELYRLAIYAFQEYPTKFTILSGFLSITALLALFVAIFIYKAFFLKITKLSTNKKIFSSRIIIILLVVFFIIAGWLINHYFLPTRFHPLSLSFDIAFLSFTFFLGSIFLDFKFESINKKMWGLKIPQVALSLLGFLLILNIGVSIYKKVNYIAMPNVILISIDTLRADHLGCYGYSKNTTPNIDRFAKDAVLFRNFISQAPLTLPSHASIFTSLICYHHQAFVTRHAPLSKKIITMAELFKNAGYKTVSFNGGVQVGASFGLGQGFDRYVSYKGPEFKKGSNFKKNSNFKKMVDEAINWFKHNKNKKTFMFLHTYEVHNPYAPKKEYLDLFENDYRGALPSSISIKLLKGIKKGKIKLNKEDLGHIINCYDGGIRSVDNSFMVLEGYLKKENIYDNTIIVFTSDHGEEFGEHGTVGWHGPTLYDELLRVPFIIKLPRSFNKNKIIYEQARSVDILPTLLDILNTGKPYFKFFDGISLYSLIKGGELNTELYAVSQIDNPEDIFSIRTLYWKLYNDRLFDLRSDPAEQQDVSALYKEKAAILKNKLFELLLHNKKGYTQENSRRDLDEETKSGLRSLGYIN